MVWMYIVYPWFYFILNTLKNHFFTTIIALYFYLLIDYILSRAEAKNNYYIKVNNYEIS